MSQCQHVQSGVQDVADAGPGRLLRQHHDFPQYPQRAGQCRRDARHRPEHLPDSGCASSPGSQLASRLGPNYGYHARRVDHLSDESEHRSQNGYIGWANLDGTNSASETIEEMNGAVRNPGRRRPGTPGMQTAIALVWNYRFGIYRNTGDSSRSSTARTSRGYSYTAANWPQPVRIGDLAERLQRDHRQRVRTRPPRTSRPSAEPSRRAANTGPSIVDCRVDHQPDAEQFSNDRLARWTPAARHQPPHRSRAGDHQIPGQR